MVTEPTERAMSHQLAPPSKLALQFSSGQRFRNSFHIQIIFLTIQRRALNWYRVSVMSVTHPRCLKILAAGEWSTQIDQR